jgi:hypothetical protein
MIRKVEKRDLLRIRELQGEHAWEFGPDFECGYAFVDANDVPVLIVGTWKKAEGHMLIDASWGTPGARQCALEACHQAMERSLYAKGYREVITYFDRFENFRRMMTRLGWSKSKNTSWNREVTNV